MERFPWMKIQTTEEMRAFLEGNPEFFSEPEGWEPRRCASAGATKGTTS